MFADDERAAMQAAGDSFLSTTCKLYDRTTTATGGGGKQEGPGALPVATGACDKGDTFATNVYIGGMLTTVWRWKLWLWSKAVPRMGQYVEIADEPGMLYEIVQVSGSSLQNNPRVVIKRLGE